MRSLFAAILCLCLMPGVFAADSDFIVKPANPGIVGASPATGTNGASSDELSTMDNSGPSSRTILGTEKNLVEGEKTPTPQPTPVSTPTPATPVNVTPISATTTPATREPIIVGNQLPQTGPMETFVIFIACLLSAAVFYSSYKRGSL